MNYPAFLQSFQERFATHPRVFRAPGRLNIIGEHTDYNEGFVLPAAIDREIWFGMAPNQTTTFRLYSVDLEEEASFTLENYHTVSARWAKYVIGVIDQLVRLGHPVSGFDAMVTGDIPLGAGLSSSAALECAALTALNAVYQYQLSPTHIAQLAQSAENQFVGVNCGIMDQFASVLGQPKHAIRIDCRDLSWEAIPLLLGEYRLILVDSLVKHNLAESEYNTRRQECEAAVAYFQQQNPTIQALRDLSPAQLASPPTDLDPVVYRRAKYITEENQRVLDASEALKKGNLTVLGQLLYASHTGMRDLFQISCPELDFLVDFTRDRSTVLGARMMGGGFGGCTINLVHQNDAEAFQTEISEGYKQAFGKPPAIYAVRTAPGASALHVD